MQGPLFIIVGGTVNTTNLFTSLISSVKEQRKVYLIVLIAMSSLCTAIMMLVFSVEVIITLANRLMYISI